MKESAPGDGGESRRDILRRALGLGAAAAIGGLASKGIGETAPSVPKKEDQGSGDGWATENGYSSDPGRDYGNTDSWSSQDVPHPMPMEDIGNGIRIEAGLKDELAATLSKFPGVFTFSFETGDLSVHSGEKVIGRLNKKDLIVEVHVTRTFNGAGYAFTYVSKQNTIDTVEVYTSFTGKVVAAELPSATIAPTPPSGEEWSGPSYPQGGSGEGPKGTEFKDWQKL